jgi:putative DNA primase/helicase
MPEVRPTALPVCPDSIPAELKRHPQWVCWAFAAPPKRRGHKPWPKIPKHPASWRNARSTDRKTWGTFAQALARYRGTGLDGIGFVLTRNDPYVAIDLDHARAPDTGEIAPWAQAVVDRLQTYAEVSPSGTGLRLFCRGKLPAHGRKRGPIEMYETGRFLTVTGCHLNGTPATIEARSAALQAVHAEVFGKAKTSRDPAQYVGGNGSTPTLTDDGLIEKALAAKNGAKFATLWRGDTSEYSSHSEADLALCALLAFWTHDEAQMDRLFRRSGLMREKWDERHGNVTYGEATIRRALDRSRARWRSGNHQRKRRGDTTESANVDGRSDESRAGNQTQDWSRPMGVTREAGGAHYTDLGKAQRFAREWHGRVRYVTTWGRWLVWDGTAWRRDDLEEVRRLARETVKSTYDEAAEIEDQEERQRLVKWALDSESRARLEVMVALAQNTRPVNCIVQGRDLNGMKLASELLL